MTKKRVLVLGQSFQDFHMFTKDDRIIDGRAKYAHDAYGDVGGIDTVAKVIRGLDLCDVNTVPTSLGRATIINKETPFVYLKHENTDEITDRLRREKFNHIHISYINLLNDEMIYHLTEIEPAIFNHFGITISADIASSPDLFDFSPWKGIINWWIARDIDLLPAYKEDFELIIAHNQIMSTVHRFGKLLYCGQATTLSDDNVVNVTGAGDVFAGTFLSYYLVYGSVEYAINCAHVEATNAVKHRANAGRFSNVTILTRINDEV